MRRVPRPVAAVVTVAIALAAVLLPAACGGSGTAGTSPGRGAGSGPRSAAPSGSPLPMPSGRTVEARSWTTSVCRTLAPWRRQITSLNQEAARAMSSATTPQQTRDNLIRLLSGARQASEETRAKIGAAGVPAVPGGDRVASRFEAALAGMRDAYGRALAAVQAIPTGDAKAFYDRVASTLETLNKEYTQASINSDDLGSDVLRKEFDEVPECNN
jgi:hypothetical protein